MVSGGICAGHFAHPSSDGLDARRASTAGGSVVHTKVPPFKMDQRVDFHKVMENLLGGLGVPYDPSAQYINAPKDVPIQRLTTANARLCSRLLLSMVLWAGRRYPHGTYPRSYPLPDF